MKKQQLTFLILLIFSSSCNLLGDDPVLGTEQKAMKTPAEALEICLTSNFYLILI